MTETELIDRLAEHKMLGAAPREELAWLAAHGFIRNFSTGDIVRAKGDVLDSLFVLLSGRVGLFIDRGSGPQKEMEWHGGEVSGLLPYSRSVVPPGYAIAQEPTVILALGRDHMREMIRECQEITAKLVHTMLDRVRAFTSRDLQDEKMVSLGKLSAGLAHELNNPAAAIERAAALIEEGLDCYEQASRVLSAFHLTDSQLMAADALRNACRAASTDAIRSPIEVAEREDAMADWLDDHGLDTSIAEALADTAVTPEALDALAAVVDGAALNATLKWAAAECAVRGIASEIQDSAMRISGLVTAVKGFTHMDQAPVSEPVDLVKGLSNTIVVLKAKARAKSIHLTVETERELPRVMGFAGELNQIWANLIDNAIDAVPDTGRIEVTAIREGSCVVIRVIDSGSGIPAEIRDRIFEPFFTTKAVGLGTGLGLDIVRRLVRHNGGEITVESQPGRTEFRVVLKLAATGSDGGRP